MIVRDRWRRAPRRSGGSVVCVAALLTFPVALFGQGGGSGADPLSRQEMLQRLQSHFEERIARELDLSDEQRQRLPGVMAEFARARGELQPRRSAFMGDVRELLAADGPEADAMALILEGRRLRELEGDLLVAEEERLLEVLEPSQVLLLQVLRDQFGDLIRAAGAGGQHLGGFLPGGGGQGSPPEPSGP